MEAQIITIKEFQFSSLRKFMSPIYGILNFNASLSAKEKQKIIYQVIPEFYKRLRLFRKFSVDELAEKSGLSTEALLGFEESCGSIPPRIERAYLKHCYGLTEINFFQDCIFDFLNPGAKESRNSMALEMLKRKGLIMPNVDYQSLHVTRGTLLNLQRSDISDGENPASQNSD